MKQLLLTHYRTIFIALALLVVPFFWFEPGVADLGGDSSRLYLYDPSSFLTSFAWWGVVPQGLGAVEPNYYYIPFLLLMIGIKAIVHSAWFIASLLNGVKLAVGFLAMYAIVRTLLRVKNAHGEAASILAGVWYALSPPVGGNMSRAIMSHNQVFLNPLISFFLLRYLLTQNSWWMWFALMTSVVFAPNVALTSAPAFFSFYSVAVPFLLFYTRFVARRAIPWRGLLTGLLVFSGLQAFHLVPQVISLFDPGSFSNTRVFDRESIAHEGIRYFFGVLPLAKGSTNVLLPSFQTLLGIVVPIVPFVMIAGLAVAKGREAKLLSLTSMFLLLVFYFLTAKVAQTGVWLYRQFFFIPGFSMFRNFIGQWQFVYAFFVALLFGLSWFSLTKRFSHKLAVLLAVLVAAFFVSSSWPFLNGGIVNAVLWESKGVNAALRMDPRYEETLAFIRSLPADGKMLTLPLTDSYYQVIRGVGGGAYVGPSTIALLTGRRDFAGYQVLGPFAEELMRLVREQEQEGLVSLLARLNIRYVFHNRDPQIYDDAFPGFPYTYMRTALPPTQEGYIQFLRGLPLQKIYENGPYAIFELVSPQYRPELYVEGGQALSVERINPTRYRLVIAPPRGNDEGILVFQNAYHRFWKLAINGKRVAEERHVTVHGYANGWRLTRADWGAQRADAMITLEMIGQRIFYGSLLISGCVFLGCIGWALRRIIQA